MKSTMTCPRALNCVSSRATDRKHYITPLHFSGTLQEAHRRLLDILSQFDRVRVVSVGEDFIRAEAVSGVMGFVDDLDFIFDEKRQLIDHRSAARVGLFDLGVNRRRLEKIRDRFDAAQ